MANHQTSPHFAYPGTFWTVAHIQKHQVSLPNELMQTPACSVRGVVAETRQIHMDYQVLWRKKDCSATLSRGERPKPCLDRLLFLFWAHYLRMVLIYYAQVCCRWLPFTENKGEDVANYIKKEGYLQM